MARINDNYLRLKSGYLFSEIARRVKEFQAAHSDAKLIRLGIGDATRPLPPAIVQALHAAVDEMGRAETFRGYGPETGYDFLTELIAKHEYGARGVTIAPDARGGYERIVYLPCTAENGFDPPLPDRPADMVYLCFPNNPTGAVLDRGALKRWVDWARDAGAVLLYDAAYESYIQDPDIPHSIYEVPGARQVAVEFRSYSKTAGFTGTRCAYTVVPRDVTARSSSGEGVALHGLWFRRQSTKFNGAPYVIQRAAAAVYTPEAQKQVRAVIDFYMENARLIREGLEAAGLSVYGGRNAPYIWVKTPAGLDSWGFFDKLLNEAHVVGTPGAGFGRSGEGYFRLTGFGDRASTEEAVARIKSRLKR